MALRESPFANGCMAGLHSLSWWLIFPCFWFLDQMIAACLPTTLEKKQRQEEQCGLGPLRSCFGLLLLLVLFVLTAPVALIGFLMWAPLQAARRPFIYSRGITSNQEEGAANKLTGERGSFGFVTANLCLFPDSLARFNNLGHTQTRSSQIAQRIIQSVNRSQIEIYVDSPSSDTDSCCSRTSLLSPSRSYGSTDSQPPNRPPLVSDSSLPLEEVVCESGGGEGDSNSNTAGIVLGMYPNAGEWDVAPDTAEVTKGTHLNQNSHSSKKAGQESQELDDVPWEVSSVFPTSVDFVCLQEVFDRRAAQKMKDILSPTFSHMLYDVGAYAFHGCCSSFKFFNSGLFFASRYPVLDAAFHCYPNGKGEDALAAKGLLCVKVQVGRNHQAKNIVGYVNCTHLHAPEADGGIRCAQLTLVSEWISEFQALTKRAHEIVVFDTLCGDFNFDNCCPGDAQEQKHKIFDEYRDPCRVGPGQEKPWVTGTLLQQPTMYDEEVLTPQSLQRSLQNEDVRRSYIAPPFDSGGSPYDYPEPGAPWVGRRIDYMLYREASLSQNCKTEIEEFTFITQLAGLTDHIPVGMRLGVSVNTEDLGGQQENRTHSLQQNPFST
ncbi:sphingomyelin phosphodiesterase 5-like [Huso huso]|uniref:sphingomyelin phosphodiesterase n=1 Tax=Huso huso TaxID=61971 RepID=A0ABR1A2G8_HUSHU